MPEQRIPTFDGDPLQYINFMRAFEYGVEDETQERRDRLAYLVQYTTREANVLVNSCLHYANSAEGYYYAKDLLKKRFGDRRQIAQAIQKRAVNWTEIKEHALETSLICILLSASRDVHFDKTMICFFSCLL